MEFLLSYLFIAPAVIGCTIAMGIFSLAASLLGASENRLHNIAQSWSRILLKLSFIRSEVVGLEKLDIHRNYVLVANHASYMDTPVVVANIPLQFRFFAKLGLFSIPLLGTHLGRSGHFPVDRGNPRASLKSMSDGAKAIAERNVSVLVFPEGGRSLDRLQEFKEGAAYIAIKAGVPAVPVALIGTREILRMHTTRVHPGLARIVIGDPIDTSHMTIKDRDQLTATLHAKIAEALGEQTMTTQTTC
jgi:1-acyl-sn-glycerol-3-phosphate acyltransferase